VISKIKSTLFKIFKGDFENAMKMKELNNFRILAKIKPEISSFFSYSDTTSPSTKTYIDLHSDSSGGYKKNNWAFQLLDQPEIIRCNNLLELGAGNGKFLEHLRMKGKAIVGIDLINPTDNPHIKRTDINDLLPANFEGYELIYSADFLEHLSLLNITSLLKKLAKSKSKNLHLIACYDDKVSHQSVYTPAEWAYIFSKFYKTVEIRGVGVRRYPFGKYYVILYAE
jgi:2-polyprenyl-3-methyl-5-hydroxy-6-metoxy-1,4-benzoquinol methylase